MQRFCLRKIWLRETFFAYACTQILPCLHVILLRIPPLRWLDETPAVVQNGRARAVTEDHEG